MFFNGTTLLTVAAGLNNLPTTGIDARPAISFKKVLRPGLGGPPSFSFGLNIVANPPSAFLSTPIEFNISLISSKVKLSKPISNKSESITSEGADPDPNIPPLSKPILPPSAFNDRLSLPTFKFFNTFSTCNISLSNISVVRPLNLSLCFAGNRSSNML